VLDARGVDTAVVVLHIDGSCTRAICGLGDRNSEITVRKPDPLEERVAPAKSHAAAHEHLGVAAELIGLHGRLRHPPGP
jgi:hypothetical protein